jgi:hypothetical protein
MNALMAAPSVTHIEHHAKHTAAGHTGFCAWFCAASQAEETAYVSVQGCYQIDSALKFPTVQSSNEALAFYSFQRGPPRLS